jgi:hypothetical protein
MMELLPGVARGDPEVPPPMREWAVELEATAGAGLGEGNGAVAMHYRRAR